MLESNIGSVPAADSCLWRVVVRRLFSQLQPLYLVKELDTNLLGCIFSIQTIDVSIDGCRYCCCLTDGVVANILCVAVLLAGQVLGSLCQPSRPGDTALPLHHAVLICMPCVLGNPLQSLGMIKILSITANVAHQDTLESTKVAVDSLTDRDDFLVVGQLIVGIVVYSVSILLILLFTRVLIEHGGCTKHGSLIVGGSPRVESLASNTSIGIPGTTVVDLSGLSIEEQLALTSIDTQCLVVVFLLSRHLTQITSCDNGRTIDTGISAQRVGLSLLPDESAMWLLGSTQVHVVEIEACHLEIFFVTKILICTNTSQNHPCDVIVILVVGPIAIVAD